MFVTERHKVNVLVADAVRFSIIARAHGAPIHLAKEHLPQAPFVWTICEMATISKLILQGFRIFEHVPEQKGADIYPGRGTCLRHVAAGICPHRYQVHFRIVRAQDQPGGLHHAHRRRGTLNIGKVCEARLCPKKGGSIVFPRHARDARPRRLWEQFRVDDFGLVHWKTPSFRAHVAVGAHSFAEFKEGELDTGKVDHRRREREAKNFN